MGGNLTASLQGSTVISLQTRFTAIARPQSNGQAEAANKIRLQGIKTQLEGAKVKGRG